MHDSNTWVGTYGCAKSIEDSSNGVSITQGVYEYIIAVVGMIARTLSKGLCHEDEDFWVSLKSVSGYLKSVHIRI